MTGASALITTLWRMLSGSGPGKNYLFCGNHDAAVRAAIVYSLVDSCKALDVNPREWMEDILLRIPGNENNREALRELLPDKWAKQTK